MHNMSSGKSALGLDSNVAALLCYLGNLVCALGLIYSIIVVVTDKTNKLARFHAWQSILTSILGFVLGIVASIVINVIMFIEIATYGIPAISGLLGLVLGLVGLGLFVLIIIAAIKGFQGQIYKIPVIGNMADKYSN